MIGRRKPMAFHRVASARRGKKLPHVKMPDNGRATEALLLILGCSCLPICGCIAMLRARESTKVVGEPLPLEPVYRPSAGKPRSIGQPMFPSRASSLTFEEANIEAGRSE